LIAPVMTLLYGSVFFLNLSFNLYLNLLYFFPAASGVKVCASAGDLMTETAGV
jgi:hypothetical protein